MRWSRLVSMSSAQPSSPHWVSRYSLVRLQASYCCAGAPHGSEAFSGLPSATSGFSRFKPNILASDLMVSRRYFGKIRWLAFFLRYSRSDYLSRPLARHWERLWAACSFLHFASWASSCLRASAGVTSRAHTLEIGKLDVQRDC